LAEELALGQPSQGDLAIRDLATQDLAIQGLVIQDLAIRDIIKFVTKKQLQVGAAFSKFYGINRKSPHKQRIGNNVSFTFWRRIR